MKNLKKETTTNNMDVYIVGQNTNNVNDYYIFSVDYFAIMCPCAQDSQYTLRLDDFLTREEAENYIKERKNLKTKLGKFFVPNDMYVDFFQEIHNGGAYCLYDYEHDAIIPEHEKCNLGYDINFDNIDSITSLEVKDGFRIVEGNLQAIDTFENYEVKTNLTIKNKENNNSFEMNLQKLLSKKTASLYIKKGHMNGTLMLCQKGNSNHPFNIIASESDSEVTVNDNLYNALLNYATMG